MAGKRSATSELNHENWDTEEDREDAGTFKRAPEDIIKTRVIKTAKRRNPISSVGSGGDKPNLWGSFTGFSKAPAPANHAFDFLSNLNEQEQPKTNGISGKKSKSDISTSAIITSEAKTSTANAMFSFGSSHSKAETISTTSASSFSVTTLHGKPSNTFATESTQSKISVSHNAGSSTEQQENLEDYYARLRGLNESVSKWIKQHVDENPFVNLQPIFKDYEKYFDELEKEFKIGDKGDASASSSTEKLSQGSSDSGVSSGASPFTSYVFTQADKVPTSNNKMTQPQKFSFSKTATSTASTQKDNSKTPAFSIDSSVNKEASEATQFSFGSTNPNKESSKCDETPNYSFGNSSSAKKDSGNNDTPTFSFGTNLKDSTKTDKAPTFASSSKDSIDSPKFSFGNTAINKDPEATPKFSFGSSNTPFQFGAPNAQSTGGFSFMKPGTGSGFTFSGVSKPETEDKKEQNEDEEDQPPKVEFTPVVEEGHIYTVRCKVFVKKDETFGDRGIGNLYLKPIPESEKMQLIVRADTNLGNLLVNIVLSESIPMKRLGKKDVMLVCIPTPEAQPPPVPVLLRVKSPEDADTLLQTLEKYKK